jgi:hypothetical protein
MRESTNYQKEIVNLSRELPSTELKKVLDFALFLKIKREGYRFKHVDDSAAFVRNLRTKEGKRLKSTKQFLEELVEWQTSNY